MKSRKSHSGAPRQRTQSSSSSSSWRQTLLLRVATTCFFLSAALQPMSMPHLYMATRTSASSEASRHQRLVDGIPKLETIVQSLLGIDDGFSAAPYNIQPTNKSEALSSQEEELLITGRTDQSGIEGTLLSVSVSSNITALPPHVVNHHVINMNGRRLLGRGEKLFVVGMPKCGTNSVTSFFKESTKYKVCHLDCRLPVDVVGFASGINTKKKSGYVGKCMAQAKENNLPIIQTCGDYDLYSQMDFPMGGMKDCKLPQISMLQELHDEHPDATFILNLRNASHWASSVSRWKGMNKRLAKCPSGPPNGMPWSLRQWYYQHVERIRQFVTDYPTHALVEIDVESSDTGGRMAKIFGLNEKYWGHHNANPKESKTL